eukprot:m.118188 g.118188  ORF g.118188 m.118188 type:complete len:2360 (+) comp37639_c0_seq1:113-7192(+)
MQSGEDSGVGLSWPLDPTSRDPKRTKEEEEAAGFSLGVGRGRGRSRVKLRIAGDAQNEPEAPISLPYFSSFAQFGRGQGKLRSLPTSTTIDADFNYEKASFAEKSTIDDSIMPSLEAEIEGPPERTLLISDLPSQATAQELEQLIFADCSRGRSVKVKVQVKGNGTAKAVLESMKAVQILWRRRYLTAGPARVLIYHGKQLKWDIAEEDECYKDKFLIENLPLKMTADQLIMRVKGCYGAEALKQATLRPSFFDESGGHKKCVISVDNPVIDENLIENLNRMAVAEFTDNDAPIFECICLPKTVLVSGMSPLTSETDIKLQFENYQSDEVAFLVDDVRVQMETDKEKSFIVTFRRQSDVDLAVKMKEFPALERRKPVIEKYSQAEPAFHNNPEHYEQFDKPSAPLSDNADGVSNLYSDSSSQEYQRGQRELKWAENPDVFQHQYQSITGFGRGRGRQLFPTKPDSLGRAEDASFDGSKASSFVGAEIEESPNCTLLIRGLPAQATDWELEQLISDDCSRGKSVKVKVQVQMQDGGSAKAVIDSVNGVAALWKRRHITATKGRCLVYHGKQLEWDIAEQDEFYDDQLLVENVPLKMTKDQLTMRVKNSYEADVLKGTTLKPLFFNESGDLKSCMIFVNASVIDEELVEGLNGMAASEFCEEKEPPCFKSVSKIKTVRVSGLEPVTTESDIRWMFHNPVSESAAFLVEDVKLHEETDRERSFIVTLRRQSDAKRAITAECFQELEGRKPVIWEYASYPTRFSSTSECKGHLSSVPKRLKEPASPLLSYPDVVDTIDQTANASQENLTLSSCDKSGLDVNIMNFVWEQQKRQRALKRAIGASFDVHWDSTTKLLSIKPKRGQDASALSGDWAEVCKESFITFQDDFECKFFGPIDQRIWDRVRRVAKEDEASLAGEIVISENPRELSLTIVGKNNTVASMLGNLSSTVSSWRRKIEEEEAINESSVKVKDADLLNVVWKSRLFGKLLETRPQAKININQAKRSVDFEVQSKDLPKFKEEIEEILDCFDSACVELGPELVHYFRTKGFQSANSKLSEFFPDASVVGTDEGGIKVKVVSLKENLQAVNGFLMKEFQSFPIDGDEPEIQDFLHTSTFTDYIKEFFLLLDAVLYPSLGDIAELPSIPVTMQVVGLSQDAQAASTLISKFLDDNVIYSIDAALPSQAHANFIKRFRQDKLRKIEKRHCLHNASVEFAERLDHLVLQAHRAGLPLLQKEVETLVDTIGKSSKKIEKHGLIRFMESEDFAKEKNHLQSKHDVIVCTSLDKEELHAPLLSSGKSVKSDVIGEFIGVGNASRSVHLVTGDICNYQVDAVVNAANGELQHYGGLAAYIVAQAGRSVQKECDLYTTRRGRLAAGQAMYTKPGNLKTTKHIIHAVGPRWPSSFSDTVEIDQAELSLMSAVSSSIRMASQLKCSSVAIPAISSGVFGCPSEECAKNVVKAVTSFVNDNSDSSVKSIHLVMKPGDHSNVRAFEKELKRHAQLKEKSRSASPKEWVSVPKIRIESKLPAKERPLPVYPSEEVVPVSTGINVEVKHGNIVNETADVIVNSTNSSLNLTSALASKALSEAAGLNLQLDCVSHVMKNGNLSEGEAAITNGYNLSCKKVLHVLCPRQPVALAKLVSLCLKTASSLEASSIAIPALGTGTLGVSNADSAKAIFAGIHDFQSSHTMPSSIRKVSLVIFDRSRVSAYLAEQTASSVTPMAASIGFSELEMDAAGGASAASAVSISQNQVQLPNGCMVAVEQGDIVTATTDVIVIPTDAALSFEKGIVAAKVLEAGGISLLFDVQTNYPHGIQSGRIADIDGGQLSAQRVYALACNRWHSRKSATSNVSSLQQSVFECLKRADGSGYTSISFPALGTGNLGFPDKESASALFEAAADFSSQSPAPSLQNIRVVVFDAPRLGTFTNKLHVSLQASGSSKSGGIAGRIGQFFGKVVKLGSAVFNPATWGKKKLDAIEPGAPDGVEIAVIGDSCERALNELITVVNKECVKEEVTGEYPENLDPKRINEMKLKALRDLHVTLSVEMRSKPMIFLSGWTKDIHKASKMVNKELMNYWKKHQESEVARAKNANVRWYWYKEGKKFCPFDDEASSQIERAYEEKTSFAVPSNGEEFYVNPAKRRMTAADGTVTKIKREDTSDGITFPLTWSEMAGGAEYEHVELVQTSWEFLVVAKRFEATKGGSRRNQIERILRIQNPRIYRFYAKEKEQIEKKVIKHGQTGSVERQLWHGTKEGSVEQITAGGFNRSYAGTNVGRILGSGVYFAVNAKYSVDYAPASLVTGRRHMFLCSVLVGLYTRGRSDLIEPPVIDSRVNRVERYDSLVDNVRSPTIFAACFRDHQAYPSYLITFK